MDGPLADDEVRRLLREILGAHGNVTFTSHAKRALEDDGLTTVDAIRVLRSGAVVSMDLIAGTWRYRVCAARICVVVAFRSESEVVVVTAWRMAP